MEQIGVFHSANIVWFKLRSWSTLLFAKGHSVEKTQTRERLRWYLKREVHLSGWSKTMSLLCFECSCPSETCVEIVNTEVMIE